MVIGIEFNPNVISCHVSWLVIAINLPMLSLQIMSSLDYLELDGDHPLVPVYVTICAS